MRDVDQLRQRVFLALGSLGLSTIPLAGCGSKASSGAKVDAASAERGKHPRAREREGAPEGEGEGEGEQTHASQGAEPPGEMVVDPAAGHRDDDHDAAENPAGEGEGREFNYYGVPTDPYATPSEGEAADCPQGDWCGPPDKASMFEAQGAERVMGCPYKIAANNASMKRIDSDDDVWDGLSLDKRMQGRLSSQHTKKSREETDDDALCCYHWYDYCAGRPLLDGGEARVAATRRDTQGAWHLDIAPDVPPRDASLAPVVADRLAAGWLDDAQMEHASVAAFARTTLELLALGAPAQLLAEVQRAAADEVEHARACFSLHTRYGGDARGPGPLPVVMPRPAQFRRLAEDTFDEGCVGETVAALVAARCLRRCEDPQARAALARIAADEAEHAALAWKTLAWSLTHATLGIGEELLARARARVYELEARPLPEADPLSESLVRHGRPTPRARAQIAREAWRGIVLPTLEALVAARP